ncbi:hypothetical protein F5B21DRAFT_502037 [Xylaria acuta]|nr:hypothetical protein F5B21DRAFT_502037 [Xylaria acuta]
MDIKNSRRRRRLAEEASAKDPQLHGLWSETVAKAMPPVEAWDQERWDIERAPRDIVFYDDEYEEGDYDMVSLEYGAFTTTSTNGAPASVFVTSTTVATISILPITLGGLPFSNVNITFNGPTPVII